MNGYLEKPPDFPDGSRFTLHLAFAFEDFVNGLKGMFSTTNHDKNSGTDVTAVTTYSRLKDSRPALVHQVFAFAIGILKKEGESILQWIVYSIWRG